MAHPVSLEAIEALKAEISSRIASTSAMFDKLDTTNWPAKDIRTYEALLEEKRQLEKDHHKLALNDVSKGAARKATRADFHNDPDDFRYDTETGGYKFVGTAPCAIDQDIRKPCNHDICRQAAKEGLSYMQYTTVRHYQSRISSAKTSRMKEALRKQRDGQLLKDKEAEAEFKEKAMKKFKSMGKEAGETIAAAAASLFPNVEGIKPEGDELEPEELDTPVERIGRELSALRARDLTTTSQIFANTVLSRLIDDKVWHTWRDPTPYVEYFSSIRISHIHATVFMIRDVLELNAIYSYELATGLRTFVDDIKTGLTHVPIKYKSSVSFTVAEALHQIKGHINPEHAQPITDLVPDGPMRRLLESCIIVEDDARAEFWDTAHHAIQNLIDPEVELNVIRDRALAKSALPSVSLKQLKLNMAHVRNYCIIHTLIRRAVQHESSAALSNAMIKYVRSMAENKPERYLDVLDDIEIVFDDLCEVVGEGAIPNEHQQLIACLFDTVQHPIGEEIRQERDTAKDFAAKSDTAVTAYLAKIRETLPMQPDTLPGMDDESSADVMRQYMRVILEVKDDAEELRDKFIEIIGDNVWRGISEAFVVFRYCKNDQQLHCDKRVFELCRWRPDRAVSTFNRSGSGLLDFLQSSHRKGWCLASTVVRLTTFLPHMSSLSPAAAKATLTQLANFIVTDMRALPEHWRASLARFGTLLLHTHGYLAIEFMALLGRSDIEQVTLTMTNILFVHVFMQPTKQCARENLHYIMIWLRFLLNPRGSTRADIWLQKITSEFKDVFEDSSHLCSTPLTCMQHDEADEHVHERPNNTGRDFANLTQSSASQRGWENEVATTSANRSRTHRVVPSNPKVTIYGSRKPEKNARTSNRLLKDHDDAIEELLQEGTLSDLVSAKVMKYCALRLKFWRDHPQSIDRETLQKLYGLFERAEKKAIVVPAKPCSNIQNTRNHCDIWELMEFREKIIGFFTGYKYNFRTPEDMGQLAKSILYFAMQGDLCWSMSEVYDLKVTHLKGIAGDLWPRGADKMFETIARKTEDMQEQPDIKLQLSINRRDYILWTQSQHEKPTFQFFYDLATESMDIFKEYARNLDIEYELMGTAKELQEIRMAVVDIVRMAEDHTLQEVEQGPLGKLSAFAMHSMLSRHHDDTVFSSDEESEEEEYEEEPIVPEIAYQENYQKPMCTQAQQQQEVERISSSVGPGQARQESPHEQSQSPHHAVTTPSPPPSSVVATDCDRSRSAEDETGALPSSKPDVVDAVDDHDDDNTRSPAITSPASQHSVVNDRRILTPKTRVSKSPSIDQVSPNMVTNGADDGSSSDTPQPSRTSLSHPFANLKAADLIALTEIGYDPEFFDLTRPVTPGLLERMRIAVQQAYERHPSLRPPRQTQVSEEAPSQPQSQSTAGEPQDRSSSSSEIKSIVHHRPPTPHPDHPTQSQTVQTSILSPTTTSKNSNTPSTQQHQTGIAPSPALLQSISKLTASVHSLGDHLITPPSPYPDTATMRETMDHVFRPVCRQLNRLEQQCLDLRKALEEKQKTR